MFLPSDNCRTPWLAAARPSGGNGKSVAIVDQYMQAKREFRDRPEPQVAILDALVERSGEGMTVLELRAAVDEDIDTIEQALSELKTENLIELDNGSDRTRIQPADRVVPDPEVVPDEEMSLFEAIRDRFGL